MRAQECHNMVRSCKFDIRIRCFHYTCDFLDSKGNARVCKHHLNPSGHFTRRKVPPALGGDVFG